MSTRVRFLLQFLIWMDYLSTQNLMGSSRTGCDGKPGGGYLPSNELPDTLGLRIDMVVDLWYAGNRGMGQAVRK